MKRSVLYNIIFLIGAIASLQAQEATSEERLSYYESRAREDAAYEQSLVLDEKEESDFWNDQEQYERELKERDKRAYRAYMRGKKDAYSEHYRTCGHHCHHGTHYYYHANVYYQRYYGPRYYRRPYTGGVRVGVGVSSPSLRVGL